MSRDKKKKVSEFSQFDMGLGTKAAKRGSIGKKRARAANRKPPRQDAIKGSAIDFQARSEEAIDEIKATRRRVLRIGL